MTEPSVISIETLADRADPSILAGYDMFLSQAGNGALFHERAFLAYHPKDRFAFSHLIVRHGNDIVALFPGGCEERNDGVWFRSPLGASFGGPVLKAKTAVKDIRGLLAAVQEYALRKGWRGIELVPPPMIYRSDGSQTLDYGLTLTGFVLSRRFLGYVLPLNGHTGGNVMVNDRFAGLFRSRNVTRTRAARRNGVVAEIGGRELFDEFMRVFDDTYTRHRTAPTHIPAELIDLMTRLPDRFRIAIARRDGIPAAGLFLMLMSASVANSFYICSASEPADNQGGLVAFAHAIDSLTDFGFRFLDLGPSSHDDGTLNTGVAFYKEGLGAVGYCRDHWTWTAGPAAGAGSAA
jgi:Acetyltransferase (GNAT) domain